MRRSFHLYLAKHVSDVHNIDSSYDSLEKAIEGAKLAFKTSENDSAYVQHNGLRVWEGTTPTYYVVGYDHALDLEDNHKRAAFNLVMRLDWIKTFGKGQLPLALFDEHYVGGSLPNNGGYVFVEREKHTTTVIVDDDNTCAACGGELETLGTLGRRKHSRCRNCGIDQSKEA